jgi:ubiquinone/menaquinone biosynthesis C-methylase UbiE
MKFRKAAFLCAFLPMLLIAQTAPKQKAPDANRRIPQESIASLDAPQRDAGQKPDQVIAALAIKQGETIADIGAGSGYFAFRFSRVVGNNGRIYAVDSNSDMIRHMNRRIRDLKLKNVATVLSDPDDPLLPTEMVDRFFICNTWHQIENKTKYLSVMKRMLRKGGQLIIIDYKKKAFPAGLPPEMQLSRKEAASQIESAGFKLVNDLSFLPDQYFLIFTAGVS